MIAGVLCAVFIVFTVVGIGWFQLAAGGYGKGSIVKIIGFAVLGASLLLFLFRRIVQDGESPHWREDDADDAGRRSGHAAASAPLSLNSVAFGRQRRAGSGRRASESQNLLMELPEEFDVSVEMAALPVRRRGSSRRSTTFPSRRSSRAAPVRTRIRRSSSGGRSACSRPG